MRGWESAAGGRDRPVGLSVKVRFRFLVFLLVVLGLTAVLVADGPRWDWPRDAAALAGIAGLAALSLWRYRWLAASVVGDVGGVGLI
ncbi:MAG TPA: hypothetical protein VML96_06060, partial [Egibacteraceae bacterium]|nr:hypothetical protein [Egibacteraceae bacterium]